MRSLDALIDTANPALPEIQRWIAEAYTPCELLPPSERRAETLIAVQVTTHSTLGAIAYETGGVLIDHGWLRFLGSGSPRLGRDLASWNCRRSDGLFLIADDAVGGFFALNGGALGSDAGNVYYWPPDSLNWEALGLGFTAFFAWSLTPKIKQFYSNLRWKGWRSDITQLFGDQCFSFYPFLWATEGSVQHSHRALLPIAEAFDVKCDIVRQLLNGGE